MITKNYALRRDQVPAFLKAIQHNRQTIVNQIQARRLCDADYYFVTIKDGELSLIPPGNHDMDVVRTSNDYIAGALIGALPFLELHGSDGIKIDEQGNVKEVELKLCMKTQDRYEITETGSLSVIPTAEPNPETTTKAVSFRSDCAAHYEIVNNLDKKDVDTYFMVFDKNTWELIAIYHMSGSKIIELIGKNQNTGEDKTSKKRSVSLSSFMKNGNEVFLDFIDSVGVIEWEHRIYTRCGRDPSEAEGFWTTARKNELKLYWSTGKGWDEIQAAFPGKTKSAIKSQIKYLKVKRPQNQ